MAHPLAKEISNISDQTLRAGLIATLTDETNLPGLHDGE
jgi:hypothetical protein